MEITKSKTNRLARKTPFPEVRYSTFIIGHFTYPPSHGPRPCTPAHSKKSPAHGGANQTIAPIRNRACYLNPSVRCAGGIDRLPATKRKSGRNDLGPGTRALSKNKMARSR